MTDFYFRTPNAQSLALQCAEYREEGHQGQQEDAPLDTIPESLRKHIDRDNYEPDHL